MRKLQQLHSATDLNFLRIPPGNRLEALSGDREGQYSIRINDQWRICLVQQPRYSSRNSGLLPIGDNNEQTRSTFNPSERYSA
ncbi:type II toxin-antitoxin system RelE/ParE family toxin [Neisseria iguanae]|uniref:type II toxin-antitoxin system RelE/ParE family toxin n=1 Tax=Neisseria iguanae TaxID=90242 RepID=UPI001B80AA02|nr:type II toxin-antitoxin system RelE/ParE family toxin [Neisseria iguanae]